MRGSPLLACLSLVLLLPACSSDYGLSGRPDVDPADVTECDFTRVGDTDFWAYDCNPVFSTTDEDWATTVGSTAFLVTEVMGHPFYQLWYTGVDQATGDFSLGYAVSAEGTAWRPYDGNPGLPYTNSGDWDQDGLDGLQAVWDPVAREYVILYQGYNIGAGSWGLGVATSPDGRDWSRLPQNPVMNLTDAVNDVTQWCWPLGLSVDPASRFRGYIAGSRVAFGQPVCEAFTLEAHSVESWSPNTVTFFPAGAAGSWDQQGFASMAVEQLGDTWYLFYVGFGGWTDHGTHLSARDVFFGMATSDDGQSWVRHGPPIPLHNTEAGQVGSVAANRVGDRIHLWITDDYDGTRAVGYFLFDPDRAD